MAQYIGLLTSAARTADAASPKVINSDNHKAAHVVVDITAGTAFNILVSILGRDEASGKDYTILSNTFNGTGTTVMRVAPELTAGANIAKDYIPHQFYVAVTQSGGISATYSIGASLI